MEREIFKRDFQFMDVKFELDKSVIVLKNVDFKMEILRFQVDFYCYFFRMLIFVFFMMILFIFVFDVF